MARHSEYQEKNRPILTILYAVAVIALVVALVLMYMNYRERRSQYRQLVRDASRTDMTLDIETRKAADEEEEAAEETAQPTYAPALPEAPLAMDEPLDDADQSATLPELSLEDNAG